jgi:hypothetical protein
VEGALVNDFVYCAILTYHPEISTFRNGRGAWRVAHCDLVPDTFPRPYVEARCGIP